MQCAICLSELEVDERWDGSYSHRCPLCKRIMIDSQIAPKEISIMPGPEIYAILSGLKTMGEMADSRYSEIDKWDD